ncbi:MAG: radical SAM protein [Bacillota bacterium]|nr:radical SAM protein [Bacillota bacterium]
MLSSLSNQKIYYADETLNAWFEELSLPVAPTCNMMCNFCSKEKDCINNGNSPEYLSRAMTPRQAVNWAIASVRRNNRIKIIRISGPGEPLCNNQTFEVLKRLNYEMPEYIYSISTNGLLLDEKVEELKGLNVQRVNVSVNAVTKEALMKLYSRVITGREIVVNSEEMADRIIRGQFNGIKRCIENGISVKVSTLCFMGINDKELLTIASRCKELGVKSMSLVTFNPRGKLRGLRTPNLMELAGIREELSKVIKRVEIKSFISMRD